MAASKKAAESTLYHLSSKGIWKTFRDAVVVNPEISTGLPLPNHHRYPPPGSRPEKYSTPATKASDPAQNPYWKRDVRRVYPQLSVVTQSELSGLLIEHSTPASVAAPGEGAEKAEVPVETKEVDLTDAIVSVTKSNKVYTEARLPPAPPNPHPRWVPTKSEDAPHTPYSYWPMSLYH
ncbi:hypothetical protein EST38_g237 [Candolleomyces aberdarensis]|uniref:Uncharacterized protein n=1 Tax=Candolleomyces aberdarensis TaxID=2316362 RepID=A0A4Q2DZ41_9AGAR|nr:hypothetical protein EST38_g237 [Candolleomyces aberdarensis]